MDRLRGKLFKGLFGVAAAMFLAGAAFAADRAAVWTGVIERMNGSEIKLAGVPERFVLTGGVTELLTGRALSAGVLAAGTSVTLRTSRRDGQGRLVSGEALVRPAGAVTLSGQIEAVDAAARRIRVEGTEIEVDDNTAIGSDDGKAHNLGDLQPGRAVVLTLQASASGGLRAAEIVGKSSAEAETEDQETSGVLTKLDATSFELDGSAAFQVTPDTRFVGQPQVGDRVEVKFHVDAQGHAVADRVRKEDAEQPADEVEFSGTVETITGSQWTISGRMVQVNASTLIEGNPKVGDTVEVHARNSAQGLVATRIQAEDKDPQPQPPEQRHVEFEGVVQSTGATWTISGRVVTVNAATRISGSPKKGDTVKVEAAQMADGTLVALEIEKEDGDMEDGGEHSGRH